MEFRKTFYKVITLFVLIFVSTAHALEYENFTLDNGLEVIVVPDHRSPIVVSVVWYKAGAADEKTGKTGIAHVLEHLMFKGTEQIAPGEFSKIIARNGGKDNAFTSSDFTGYYQKIAKDKLAMALEMEADRMVNLTLSKADFTPELKVVMEERRLRTESKPMNRFFEELQKKHMEVHPYGNPVIGWMEDLENLNVNDAMNWYKTYYSPTNAVLTLVGDITKTEAEPLVKKYFANIPKREIIRKPWAVEPLKNTLVEFNKVDEAVQIPVLYRIYRAPSHFAGIAGTNEGTKDSLALVLLSEVLGGGATSRLYEKLVKDLKLADGASASYSAISRGESSFDIFIQPKPGVRLKTVELAAEVEINRLMSEGVAVDELERAKTKMLATDIYRKDNIFYRAYNLGNWIMAGGRAKTFDDWQEDIKYITVGDLQRVAKKYLQAPSTTGRLVPDDSYL